MKIKIFQESQTDILFRPMYWTLIYVECLNVDHLLYPHSGRELFAEFLYY
jgi:hypothetical protein